ncbi:MAG: DUF2270 domain-containing protein [Bellilinea sp.]|jgi:uncharacterized membrane protein
MVHYYRAEIQRSNIWRTRLDSTTNWAVITTGATLSFVLSSPANHFIIIPLNTILISVFLWMEARRYRYYELWSYRTRLMETDFFAAMLVPPFAPHAEWAESLAQSLLQPDFPITMWEAAGRRLRRNYFWIYIVLLISWVIKIILHPLPVSSLAEFIGRSAIAGIPGELVILGGLTFYTSLIVFAVWTARFHQASGEVLPKYDVFPSNEKQRADRPAFMRRKQLLVWMVTDRPDEISKAVMVTMHRGVTAINGTGMYTKKGHYILMVAVTVTEIAELKRIVQKADPKVFIVVNPAQEIFGGGFQPLEEQEDNIR